MRAGLLLPACIVLSALAHMLLVAAVAVPPKRSTTHGETVTVDLVPANEVPDLPQVPESSSEPSAAPEQDVQPAEPPQPQSQLQAQSQPDGPQRPPPQQPQQSPQPQPSAQQQASQPWPDQPQQPAPAETAPGGSLAEQRERLTAMLNLPGPNTGDGTGAEADTKAQLTAQEIAAFRAHLKSCWQLPAGVTPNQRLKIVVRMSLRQNGSLAADPQLIEAAISPMGPPLVQAAVKAIKQCAPYTTLPAAKYNEWRVLDINFSPDEMARG